MYGNAVMHGVLQTIRQQHSYISVQDACTRWLSETKVANEIQLQRICQAASRAFSSVIRESNSAHVRITTAQNLLLRQSDWNLPYWEKPLIVSPISFHGHDRVYCNWSVSVGDFGRINNDFQNAVKLACAEYRWRTRWLAVPNCSYLLHCNFAQGTGTLQLRGGESYISIDIALPQHEEYPSIDFVLINEKDEVKLSVDVFNCFSIFCVCFIIICTCIKFIFHL